MMPESVLFSINAMFEDLQSNQEKGSGVFRSAEKNPGKFESKLCLAPQT
jgi:hypothetical protein